MASATPKLWFDAEEIAGEFSTRLDRIHETLMGASEIADGLEVTGVNGATPEARAFDYIRSRGYAVSAQQATSAEALVLAMLKFKAPERL